MLVLRLQNTHAHAVQIAKLRFVVMAHDVAADANVVRQIIDTQISQKRAVFRISERRKRLYKRRIVVIDAQAKIARVGVFDFGTEMLVVVSRKTETEIGRVVRHRISTSDIEIQVVKADASVYGLRERQGV